VGVSLRSRLMSTKLRQSFFWSLYESKRHGEYRGDLSFSQGKPCTHDVSLNSSETRAHNEVFTADEGVHAGLVR